MSTSPNGALDEIIQLYSSFSLNDMVQMAPPALIAYEYLITFDQEIALFWGSASCNVLSNVQAYVSVVQYPAWAAFAGLRTLALSKMNWVLASTVFFLALGPFAVNLWAIPVSLIGVSLPPFGCGSTNNLTPRLAVMGTHNLVVASLYSHHQRMGSLLGVAIARSCSIAADMLVIAVTWRSQLTSATTFPGRSSSSLGNVMIINGTLYFLVIAALNVAQLVFTPLSILVGVENISEVAAFTDPASAVLICRFLLELQHAHQKALDEGSIGTLIGEDGNDAAAASLQFATAMIGSIGESIDVGPDATSPDIYGDDDGYWQACTGQRRRGDLVPAAHA
ncbi:hypothetical protein VTO73DRAFT_2611 [Trametes versicolor]